MTELEREQVNSEIRRIAEVPAAVAQTATGRLLSGLLETSGKRIRPMLMYAAASFGDFGGPRDEETALLLARSGALLELTHLASLIHDDIIDDADTRRGKPSVQARYGKDAAVFAGDFLIARIQGSAAAYGMHEVSRILSEAVESMCIGEIGQALSRYRTDRGMSSYYEVIRGKTAALFQAALQIGARCTGCDAETTATLLAFGEAAGILFQLKDDLLNLRIADDRGGKPAGNDIREGIYTLPLLLALETNDGKAALLPMLHKNAADGLCDEELKDLIEAIGAHGGIAGAEAVVTAKEADCRRLLAGLPEGKGREELAALLEQLAAYG